MLQIFLKFISRLSSKITAASCKRNLCTTTVSLRKSQNYNKDNNGQQRVTANLQQE